MHKEIKFYYEGATWQVVDDLKTILSEAGFPELTQIHQDFSHSLFSNNEKGETSLIMSTALQAGPNTCLLRFFAPEKRMVEIRKMMEKTSFYEV